MITIEDIHPGDGPEIKEGDGVTLHYTGTFLDGSKFDSSKDRGNPMDIVVGVTGLIEGFTLGVIGMREGGHRKITIPYHMAYGEAGRPPMIPAKADLIFELEVLFIRPS
jgi:peptidylprolyl isomerase